MRGAAVRPEKGPAAAAMRQGGMSDQATKGSPWDVFTHLLAVIAVYLSIYGAPVGGVLAG